MTRVTDDEALSHPQAGSNRVQRVLLVSRYIIAGLPPVNEVRLDEWIARVPSPSLAVPASRYDTRARSEVSWKVRGERGAAARNRLQRPEEPVGCWL